MKFTHFAYAYLHGNASIIKLYTIIYVLKIATSLYVAVFISVINRDKCVAIMLFILPASHDVIDKLSAAECSFFM